MAKPRVLTPTGFTKQCCRCQLVKDTSEFHRYARNKAKAHSNRRWLHEYLKTKKCKREGCDVDAPDMLVFDHLLPGDKRLEVSRMAQQTYSLKSLQAEVAKCRVLCGNHQQKHTIQQFGYKKWLTED